MYSTAGLFIKECHRLDSNQHRPKAVCFTDKWIFQHPTVAYAEDMRLELTPELPGPT